MNFPFFKNRKSRRELEAEVKKLSALVKEAQENWDRQLTINAGLRAEKDTLQVQPPPTPKIELIPSTNLTLAKWLKEENLIASAANILKHPDMRAMLDVLENEHPGRRGLAITATTEQRAAWQAETQGFQRCLNTLRALGDKPGKKPEIAETYAEENAGGKK